MLPGKASVLKGSQGKFVANRFSYHVNGQLLKSERYEGRTQTSVLHISGTLNKVTKANGDELWRHSLRVGGEVVTVIEKVGKTKSKQK